MKINSATALLIYFCVMVAAYVVAIGFPAAPFIEFATQITIGLGAYYAKRHMDKKIPPAGTGE